MASIADLTFFREKTLQTPRKPQMSGHAVDTAPT